MLTCTPSTLVLVASLAALLFSCSTGGGEGPGGASEDPKAPGPGAAPAPSRALPIEAVVRRSLPKRVVLMGTLSADRHADLAANAAGRVLQTFVERGQAVRQGDLIARLDARLASFSAKAAEAQRRAAKSQLEQAERECQRAQALFASGAMTKAEYDVAQSRCATQSSTVSAAEASAALANIQAGDAVVRAPFAGRIGERFVEVGEYALPSTRVASLYAIDPIRVSIPVPEVDVGRVELGQVVSFRVAALPGEAFEGVVRYVSPALRTETRDLVVEALAANPKGSLRPGMFATVEMVVGTEELPVVPSSAVSTHEGRAEVWRVSEGRAIRQLVRVGARDGEVVGIRAGLGEGDQVVSQPPTDLVEGTRIASSR